MGCYLASHGRHSIELQQPWAQSAVHQEVHAHKLKGHAWGMWILCSPNMHRALPSSQCQP